MQVGCFMFQLIVLSFLFFWWHAGRTRPGTCFKLYTRNAWARLLPQETPELLRLPLEQLCLRIKVLGYGDVEDFVGKLLDAPDAGSVTTGLQVLRDVGALSQQVGLSCISSARLRAWRLILYTQGGLTSLGRMLGEIQADLRIGKMLIFGTILRCLDAALTIAACLVSQAKRRKRRRKDKEEEEDEDEEEITRESTPFFFAHAAIDQRMQSYRSPFLTPYEQRDAASAVHKRFATGKSDLLAMYNAYSKWEQVSSALQNQEIKKKERKKRRTKGTPKCRPLPPGGRVLTPLVPFLLLLFLRPGKIRELRSGSFARSTFFPCPHFTSCASSRGSFCAA